jgi:hypothetical protein
MISRISRCLGKTPLVNAQSSILENKSFSEILVYAPRLGWKLFQAPIVETLDRKPPHWIKHFLCLVSNLVSLEDHDPRELCFGHGLITP